MEVGVLYEGRHCTRRSIVVHPFHGERRRNRGDADKGTINSRSGREDTRLPDDYRETGEFSLSRSSREESLLKNEVITSEGRATEKNRRRRKNRPSEAKSHGAPARMRRH